jgi:hypothetical protein
LAFVEDNTPGESDVKVVAEYRYRLDVNATDHRNGMPTSGYYTRDVDSKFVWDPLTGMSNCPDDSNGTISVRFRNGKCSTQVSMAQVGHYRLQLIDEEWTRHDHDPGLLRHHTLAPQNFRSDPFEDCIMNSGSVESETTTPIPAVTVGCEIRSQHTNADLPMTYSDLNFTFIPDHFTFDTLELTSQPRGDNTPWIYMSDLDINTTMSAELNATLTARGTLEGPLSNYRHQCAAEAVDVTLDFNITNEPAGVPFEHRLETRDGVLGSATDANTTASIGSTQFGENGDTNGSASFTLYYNFKKPLNNYVNVADVNFTRLDANATYTAGAHAYGRNDFLPSSYDPTDDSYSGDINESRYFYYARIVARDNLGVLEPSVPRNESGTTHGVRLYVDVYCEDNGTIICADLPGMADSPELYGTLYRASESNSWDSSRDGKIHDINNTTGVGTIAPNTDITFDSEAKSGVVTVTYTDYSHRPVTVMGLIEPDPWLEYKDNNFTIRFIRDIFHWKGEGEVGHVIDIPNAGKSNRTGW